MEGVKNDRVGSKCNRRPNFNSDNYDLVDNRNDKNLCKGEK